MRVKERYISLREFQLHTRIDAQQLVRLLDAGLIPCRLNESGALEVEVASVAPRELGERMIESTMRECRSVFDPETVIDKLSPLLEDAVALALEWLQQDQERLSEE